MGIRNADLQDDLLCETRLAPFVRSKVFTNLFAHGMELVEETATYLDNGGRKAAKSLSREAAMTYAGVSMRLTTRLMQIASWLLVLRAVRDTEMTEKEAQEDKYRIGPAERYDRTVNDIEVLPEELRDLIEQTDTLYARISRLDRDLFTNASPLSTEGDAKGRMQALMRAFPSE
ncbi:DUF1465 family protein [Parvularcula sp. LCG005]|uniref:DUF1465 family protein n=1 Tax=Parvularcula sp. LCG005 TaxID=3078805 RepID=UPI00294393D5|nr:DUF1465 family protein [Parvularcula sp. LCG005]WOI53766.1 DUF1465 family protein [Parvularcula sp. LCG005]